METTLLALPVTDLAIIGGLAVLGCVLGWQTRRLATRGREAELKRSLFEAKGAIPQLESALRNREQRADSLALEVKALRERLSENEASARQKELEIAKRDRDIRSLSSELKIVKDGTSSAAQVFLEGEDSAADATSADPELAKRYAALEARYDALARGLFQRDDRIAELEEQLKNPGNELPTRTLEQELTELEQTSGALQTTLQEREEQLEALQTRLQEEVAQREALEDLAKRRGDGNRELKAAAAKLEQQIPALMETIKSRDSHIAERDEKLVSLNRALKDERQQREVREAEVAELQTQLVAMESRHRDLQERLREHDEARRTLEAELRSTSDTLRTTESVVREREAAIENAERRIVEANERTESAERMTETLHHTIKDRDFRIAELETAASQQSAKLELLRSTFQDAKASHNEHIAKLNARHDEQRQASERTISQLQMTLADREIELNGLTSTAAELAHSREAADALTRQVAQLTESLARSSSALRQRQCAILLLLARLGASQLLLPAPAASVAIECGELPAPSTVLLRGCGKPQQALPAAATSV